MNNPPNLPRSPRKSKKVSFQSAVLVQKFTRSPGFEWGWKKPNAIKIQIIIQQNLRQTILLKIISKTGTAFISLSLPFALGIPAEIWFDNYYISVGTP